MTSESQNNIWYSAEVDTARDATEAVEFALLEMDALGTEINTVGKNKDAEIVTVIGYFHAPPKLVDVRAKVDEALAIYNFPATDVSEIRVQEVEQRDWLAEWKKGWQPVESARFTVAPTWSEVADDAGRIVIRIEPGMAFGTGTHETTRLCLAVIDEYYTGGSFLDVGTGTAVLAIAAAKMFPAARIEACDTDTDSVVIARENAELNSAAENIRFYEGSITAETGDFQFVCANLTADVILPILPLLVVKSTECLVLSGILAEQRESVEAKLNELGQESFKVEQMGEWISIVVDRQ